MELKNIMLLFFIAILLIVGVCADGGVFDNTDYNEYSIYNLTNVTAELLIGNLTGNADTSTTWDGETSQADLNVNHSDTSSLAADSTAWITLTSLQAKWFADVGNVLTFDEPELNTSIEAYGYSTTVGTVTSVATDDNYLTGGTITSTGTIAFNDTELNATIDAQDVIYNDSMETYVGLQDTTFNSSMKTYTDTTFITLANEGNLNVNHSDTSSLAADSTAWITMTSLQAKWFSDATNVLTFDEPELNTSIEAYGYSTTVGTVTSVATDDTYLTGGAITDTGTITFNSTLAGTTLAVNSSDYWDGLGDPTDITSLGTISSATSITSSAFDGPLNWTDLQNYPSYCSSGLWVNGINDSVPCSAPTAEDVDPGTFPAGNYVYQNDLNVSTINHTSPGTVRGFNDGSCEIKNSSGLYYLGSAGC